MAKTVRTDRVAVSPDGSVSVEFTAGQGPLPPPGGNALTYSSLQALYSAIQDLEDNISDEQLVLIALSQGLKADPQMANLALFKNRTAQLDLTGSGTVIRVA